MTVDQKKLVRRRKLRAIRKHSESVQQRMWKASAHLYGQDPNSPMPKTRHGPKGTDKLYVGYYQRPGGKPGSGEIVYPDWAAKRIAGHGTPKQVDEYRRLVMHEWAHRFQGKGVKSAVAAEGGAEGFAREMSPSVMKKLGWRYKQRESGRQYGSDVRKVLKKKGRKYIESGQFK